MRVLTGLLLSLLLAVTSVTMAVARASDPPGGGMTVTLCSQGETATIVLDANGNPVAPHLHLCPDCLTGGTAATLPGASALPQQPPTRGRPLDVPVALHRAGLPPVAPRARAPPLPTV